MNVDEFMRECKRAARERVALGTATPDDVELLAWKVGRRGRLVTVVPSEPTLRICLPGHRAATMSGHSGRKPTVMRVGMTLGEEIGARWPILVADARALPPLKLKGAGNRESDPFLEEYRCLA